MKKNNPHQQFADDLIKDPVRLKKFMRAVMGPPYKTLEGKEREQTALLLSMIHPFKETNNQHSWTAHYMIGETEYHVTHFSGEDPIIDKMLPEEEE